MFVPLPLSIKSPNAVRAHGLPVGVSVAFERACDFIDEQKTFMISLGCL